MIKNWAIKAGVVIVLSYISILAWIYALYTWKIDYNEFRQNAEIEAEIIDDNQ